MPPRSKSLYLTVLLGAGLACTRGASGTTPAAATSVASSVPTASVAATLPRPADGWVEAMRAGRAAEVLRMLAELEPESARAPRVRYARARAALASGDFSTAVTLLGGLESELPLLADEVVRERALAQLEAGPYEVAAGYFSATTDAADLARACRAWERAGQVDRALKAAERSLAAAQRERSRQREAEARSLRARLLELLGQRERASGDYRWLATRAPTSPHAADAAAALARVQPGAALTADERRARALAFADVGDLEAVEIELAALARESGKRVSELDALRARGYALFASRRDPLQAAELLEKAARLGRADTARDSFYAARSRVRGRDEAGALRILDALATRDPRSPWVERARFERARVELMLARWDAAAQNYSEYLARYPHGSDRAGAEYERAVAWLAGGRFGRAAAAFERLITASDAPPVRARLRELMALALTGAGQRERAVSEFKNVIREHPLGFAALLAHERLVESGEVPPAPLETVATPLAVLPALTPALTPKASLLQSLGLDADAERELAKREPELRRRYGARGDEVLCLSYAALAVAQRRYSVGRRQQDALRFAPAPATRWAWDCSHPRPFEKLVLEAERAEALPSDLLYAVMRQESAFQIEARSPADAKGLLQLMLPTARNVSAELGLEWRAERLTEPWYNVRLGARYLKKLLGRFGGHPALAVAAYNAGPQALSRWLETGERLPLDVFVARIPYAETREYVHQVLTNLARYRYLALGEAGLVRLPLLIPLGLRATPDDY